MRHKALMVDRVVVSTESLMSNEELIDALAKGDDQLRDSLRLSLASKDGWSS